MSFILFMLILTQWCNTSGFPLDQHPAKNLQSDGSNKVADPADLPVKVPLQTEEDHQPVVKPSAGESPKVGAPEKPVDANAKKQAGDSAQEGRAPTASSKADSTGDAGDFKSHKKFNHANVTEMDSSTLKRLVLVLVALSILFILYLAFRTYRTLQFEELWVQLGMLTLDHSLPDLK